MSSPSALPLARELERAMPERPFSVEFWAGTRVPGTGDGPTFAVRPPAAVARAVRSPGHPGLGRAYLAREPALHDLQPALQLLGRWDPPPPNPPTPVRPPPPPPPP